MKTILLDMDNVLMDFNGRLIEIYNDTHEDQVTREMITHWNFGGLPAHVGKEMDRIWRHPDFFMSLKPLNDALEYVPKLVEEHNCYIASDAFGMAYRGKDHSLETYFPELLYKKFYGRDKWMIRADVLLDDKIETLNLYRAIGDPICYTQYHNIHRPDREENFSGIRVVNMQQFYELMKGL